MTWLSWREREPGEPAPHAGRGEDVHLERDVLAELCELAEAWKATEPERRSKGLPQTLANTHATAVQRCGLDLAEVLDRVGAC